MMEFVFKAKRIDNGEWIEGMPIYSITAGLEVVLEIIPEIDFNGKKAHIWADRQAVDASTLTQFTGRYDSNGKRIFAGDIIKISCYEEFTYEEYDICKYDDESCSFRLYSDSGYTEVYIPNVGELCDTYVVEIIDNEFDTNKKWEWRGL